MKIPDEVVISCQLRNSEIDFFSFGVVDVQQVALATHFFQNFRLNDVLRRKDVAVSDVVSSCHKSKHLRCRLRELQCSLNFHEPCATIAKELISGVCDIFCFFNERLECCDCININSGYEELQTFFTELFPLASFLINNKIGFVTLTVGFAVITRAGVRREIPCRDDKSQILAGQININEVFPINATGLYRTAERPIVFCEDKTAEESISNDIIDLRETVTEFPDEPYYNNLKTVLANEYVPLDKLGLLVSAPKAISRYYELKKMQEEKEKLAKSSNYIGEIGEKISVNFISGREVACCETQFGILHIYEFKDVNGNTVIWKTSSGKDIPENGVITGTVKAHEEYDGIRQTVILRAKITE